MQGIRRTIVALGAAATLLTVLGCGGLGVNIGSGTSRGSKNVNSVGIQVQSGPNVPSVTRGRTILLIAIAYYQYGSNNFVSATQGAIFTTPRIPCGDSAIRPAVACGDIIRFMDPSCSVELQNTVSTGPVPNPVAGSTSWWTTTIPSQNVCVLGVNPGTANLYATVQGVTGVITVTVL